MVDMINAVVLLGASRNLLSIFSVTRRFPGIAGGGFAPILVRSQHCVDTGGVIAQSVP